MAAVTSPARHAASLATSASTREPRRSKVHRAMEWLKPSSAPSSVIMSASVRARMQTPSCTSYQLGSLTTTRFTRTRHSDIVHPVSSSQLTETRDHVRSFGGYNTDPTLAALAAGGTRLIALRSAGFNNVDLASAGIRQVSQPGMPSTGHEICRSPRSTEGIRHCIASLSTDAGDETLDQR